MMRCCAAIAFGAVAGIALGVAAVYVVLMFGGDTVAF